MRMPRRLPARLTAAGLTVSGVLALASGAATPASTATLSSRLAAKQAAEQRLGGAVAAASKRLAQVQGSLAGVQGHLNAIEADLSAKQARLGRIEAALRRERAHLVRLQIQLAGADRALAANLLSQYESDPPDAISVILNSHGFADMMDRLEFVRQAKQRDAEVIRADKSARTVVVAAATSLGRLDLRQQTLTDQIRVRRDAVDRIRLRLVDRSIRIERSRSAKAASLDQARAERRRLQGELARLNAPASGGSPGAVPLGVLRGGGVVFPMPGGAASPPGSWTDDQGVDISAPGNTPLLAVGSGTIVLHGIGGFGPSAPVLHLDSPIAGYSYVYYGHAGPGNMVAIGSHVSAGQVISEVGAGIVGISTGPHLEIGFADASGSPVGSGSSGTMHALLLSAYHG